MSYFTECPTDCEAIAAVDVAPGDVIVDGNRNAFLVLDADDLAWTAIVDADTTSLMIRYFDLSHPAKEVWVKS